MTPADTRWLKSIHVAAEPEPDPVVDRHPEPSTIPSELFEQTCEAYQKLADEHAQIQREKNKAQADVDYWRDGFWFAAAVAVIVTVIDVALALRLVAS